MRSCRHSTRKEAMEGLNKITRAKGDWKSVTEEDVKRHLTEIETLYQALSRKQVGEPTRKCCMDDFMNQSATCNCVWRINQMRAPASSWDDKLDYEIICQEISEWFQGAGLMENLCNTHQVSKLRFYDSFRKTITHRRSSKGTYTRMIDMSISPDKKIIQEKDYTDDIGVDVPENFTISQSTLCLNTVLHLWGKIAGGDFGGRTGTNEFYEWQARKYDAILRWNAKIQEDVSAQVRKQRLFFSRIDDFLEAKGKRERVYLNKAEETFQQRFNLGTSKKETTHWRKRAVNFWKRWNFAAIHILQSNSEMMYNVETKELVSKLDIRIAKVSDSTTSTLYELAESIEKCPRKWSRVAQDKKLWYYPFENCHDLTSALQVHFGQTGKGSRSEEIKRKLADGEFMMRVQEADKDLRDVFLEMLNRQKGRKKYTEVAYQPSILMSKVHHPQEAHWDYQNNTGAQEEYLIAFLALTRTGQFLQLWEYEKNPENIEGEVEGNVVFIPHSELVMVKGNVLHAGGFRAETGEDGRGAHMRIHFYVYPGKKRCMIPLHINETKDSEGLYLRKRYVDNKILQGKLDEGGNCYESLGWTFFQGKCPVDKLTGVEQKRKHFRTSRKGISDTRCQKK
jgi:hypothetical protein